MSQGFVSIVHKGEVKQIQTERLGIGMPQNPTLVFLHEGLGCAGSWKDIPPTLGRLTRCNVFSYTRMGYGQSSAITLPRKINYLHIEALNLLPLVLRAAGINRYILVGHSDGGSIALIHGGRRPRGLMGIITLAAHLFCEPVTVEGLKEARNRYVMGDLRPRLEKIHGPNTHTAFWGWNDTWLSPRFMHWNIEKYLKTIQVPVLAIQGQEDPYATPAQLYALKAGLPQCRIQLIENCGHIPHLQHPREVAASVSQFVDSLLDPA